MMHVRTAMTRFSVAAKAHKTRESSDALREDVSGFDADLQRALARSLRDM
jgi:hypothetical protein